MHTYMSQIHQYQENKNVFICKYYTFFVQYRGIYVFKEFIPPKIGEEKQKYTKKLN